MTIITTPEKFSFESNIWFREQMRKALESQDEITIDLRETHYIDSSALGMLLGLRERSGKNVTLINAGKNAYAILQIANFQKLFTIHKATNV